jgi:hypothetical protein
MVVCSDYISHDSKDSPLSKESEKLMFYCETENLHLDMGWGDSNAHHTV